jgi:hypothetical protein
MIESAFTLKPFSGLAGRSCTGIAVTAEGVVAVNWRTKTITEVCMSIFNALSIFVNRTVGLNW